MKNSILFLTATVFFGGFSVSAQSKTDTILIDADKVNTKELKPSANRYLVYFKMGKDSARSRTQFWTRNIGYADYNGREAIVPNRQWR